MLKSIFLLLFISNNFLTAETLMECVNTVIKTNPNIQKYYNIYKVARGDISVAQSAYYPKLNLSLGHGSEESDQYNRAGSTDISGLDLDVSEYLLAYTHNIFDGFATTHRVVGEKARTKSAAYAYLEQANTKTFEMVDAYLQQLKYSELLTNAKENITINKKILTRVEKLFKSGLTTYSEVNKVLASHSLSQSNYILHENNLLNAQYNLEEILGNVVDVKTMKKPHLAVKIPNTYEEALSFALKNNPSIRANEFTIKFAQEKWKEKRAKYYPELDIEVSQSINENLSAIQGNDDRFRMMLVLKYNFFNGFADSSEIEKSVHKVNEETFSQSNNKRKISKDLRLSFASYTKLTQQTEHIKQYKAFTYKTLTLYSKEYDLGKRSLLDLLSVQNDFIAAKAQMINVDYSLLLAKYRILNAMGTMVSSTLGTDKKIHLKVQLLSTNSIKTGNTDVY